MARYYNQNGKVYDSQVGSVLEPEQASSVLSGSYAGTVEGLPAWTPPAQNQNIQAPPVVNPQATSPIAQANNTPLASQDPLSSQNLAQYIKNPNYNPNDPSVNRYIPSTAPAQNAVAQPTAPKIADYKGLENRSGTIYLGDRAFSSPAELAQYLGIKPHEINWANIPLQGATPTATPQAGAPPAGTTPPVGATTPPAITGAVPGASGVPEGITAVFGPNWQPADIFNQRGLVNKGILGAVSVTGSPDVFTIGPGGGWVKDQQQFQDLFGTTNQAGIVGEISPEQAKLLGINPEGITELKNAMAKETNISEIFKLAQQAGLSLEDTMNLISAQYPVDTAGIEKKLGIPDVVGELFKKPSQTIQEMYQEGYDKSGLPDLKTKIAGIDEQITKARADLATATNQINANPWISESSRVGKMGKLSTQAENTINNLTNQRKQYLDMYDKGASELEGVMLRAAKQYEQSRTLLADQLNYLLGESERMTTEAQRKQISENMRYVPDYLKAEAARLAEEKTYKRGKESKLTIEEQLKLKAAGYTLDKNGNIINEPADISSASVLDIMNAIKQVESGGDYNAKGASGESGAYQFMPGTWKSWSQQYANEVLKMSAQLEMTPENQDAVAEWKIKKLVDQGYTPQQIASIWNSGKPEWEGKVGTNKQGVKYDVPGYVNKIVKALGKTVKGPTAKLSASQISAGNKLAKDIYGAGAIKTKDGYANFVNPILERMKAGENIDSIADDLRLQGQSTEFTGTIRDAAQQITSRLSVGQTEAIFDKLDDVLSLGETGKVLDFLKKMAIENSAGGVEQAQRIMGQERTVEFLDEIYDDLIAYEKGGGKTNIFTGSLEEIAKKAGTVVSPELRKLAVKITKARQQYRRSMTGVAFSPGENLEYDAVFPGINRTKDFNTANIQGLRESFKGDVDYFYSFAMGKEAYNELFKGRADGMSDEKAYREYLNIINQ